MSESIHAWYSKKQFDNKLDTFNRNDKECNFPYIYYKLKSGNIVQITEVTREKKHHFDDAHYLGEIEAYYTCSKTHQKF